MAAADTPSNDCQGLTESEVEDVIANVDDESEYNWSHWRSSPRFSCWKQERNKETAMIQVGGDEPLFALDYYEERESVVVMMDSRERLAKWVLTAAFDPELVYEAWETHRDKQFVEVIPLPVPDEPTSIDVAGMLARQAMWEDRRFDNEGENE